MKKILIVSADDIILYQPTILNLYDYLKNDFEITIISFEPEFLGKKKDTTRNIVYLKTNKSIKRVWRILDLFLNAFFKRIDKYLFKFNFRTQFVRHYKCKILIEELQNRKADHVIAVDLMPLFAAQKVFGLSIFLSLEIFAFDPYRPRVDENKITAVIIQNQQRFDFLFNHIKPKVFYIQNAPLCKNICLNENARDGLVWGGTIAREFAIFDCLNFIRAFPDYFLLLKGAAPKNTLKKIESGYNDILSSGRVIVNTEYLSAEELIKTFSAYKIGFSFYDWQLIKKSFNYQTAPSGKLFMYLAAGVPVIACDIPGFKFIEENGAGVLVKDYAPDTILNAIQIIEADYLVFQKNSYKVFFEYCFDNGAKSFRSFLMSN